MERNTELILKVREHILTKPGSYSQSNWLEVPAEIEDAGRDFVLVEQISHDPNEAKKIIEGVAKRDFSCGATACVAGTAALLSDIDISQYFTGHGGGDYFDGIRWQAAGADVLGLDYEEADWLFSPDRSEQAMPDLLQALANNASLDELIYIEDEWMNDHD